jgi:phosphoribosyl 1,2-cyclic phosphodiesterase
MGTVGGNTTCIEVRLDDNNIVIFDCGSGIRELGNSMKNQPDYVREYNIFFTHFHWDHLQGLPFFIPQAYDPRCALTFHSPRKGYRVFLEEQMKPPYFPVTMDALNAKKTFIRLEKQPRKIGIGKVYWRPMKHPGGCFAYKIVENGKTMIFSTDTELIERDFLKNDENRKFFQGVDLLILDSQYTLDEAIEKYDWGHSSYSLAVDFAAAWNIKKLVLFHHEPQYNDKKLYSIFNSAKWYLQHLEKKGIEIFMARENLEIRL